MGNGYNMAITPRKYRQPPEPPMMHLILGYRIDRHPAIPFPGLKSGDACRVFFSYDQDAQLIGDDYHGGPEINMWYPARLWFRLHCDENRGAFILYARDNEAFLFLCDLSPEFVNPRPSAKCWTGPIPKWAQPRLF